MNRTEDRLLSRLDRDIHVTARSIPAIDDGIKAAVKTIAEEMDIMARKKMVRQMYRTFQPDAILKIHTMLDFMGITLPSI